MPKQPFAPFLQLSSRDQIQWVNWSLVWKIERLAHRAGYVLFFLPNNEILKITNKFDVAKIEKMLDDGPPD